VPGVATVVNENYANTNMVESLICARSKFAASTIISYGDIVYERSVLTKLIAADDSIAVVVDENWKRYWELRFVNPLDDAESLKIDSEGYLTSIGQKEISFESIAAQYIGLMKFQSDGVRALERFYDDAKRGAASRLLPVRNGSSFEQIYMTDLLQGLINAGHKLKAIPIKGGWLEIDSLTDYETYLRMHAENTLRPFFDTRSD
jgi:choline kinase